MVTGGGGVALVEQQVDHLQHRGQAGAQFIAARDFKGYARLGQGALGAHDALGHRGLGHQESAGDFMGAQAAQQLERQRQPRFGGKHRVTGGEDQAQQVVADLVLPGLAQRIHKIGHNQRFLRLQLVADLLQLFAVHLLVPQVIQRTVFGHPHQPGAGIVRHTLARPAFQCGHQRVLRQLLSQPDVAHQTRHRGHDLRGLDAPDG